VRQIHAWDELLFKIRSGKKDLDIAAIDDTRTKSQAADEEARRAQESVDRAVGRLTEIATQLKNEAAVMEGREVAINKRRFEDGQHRNDAQTIMIVGKVAAVAAGAATGGTAGLAIGAALNVGAGGLADSAVGKPVSPGSLLKRVPQAIDDTKAEQAAVNKVVGDWNKAKDDWSAYRKAQDRVAGAQTEAEKKAARDQRDQAWGNVQDKLGNFYDDAKGAAGMLIPGPPEQIGGDQYEAEDGELQNALRQKAALEQERAELNDSIRTGMGHLQAAKDKKAELSLKEEFIRRVNMQNDQENARLEALAWMLRQRHIRDLASNSAVLLRSFKYHTGRDVDSPINSTYFASYYRLQRPITGGSENKQAEILYAGDPVALQKALETEATNLERELNELETAVQQGYKEYLSGIALHQELQITTSFSGTGPLAAATGGPEPDAMPVAQAVPPAASADGPPDNAIPAVPPNSENKTPLPAAAADDAPGNTTPAAATSPENKPPLPASSAPKPTVPSKGKAAVPQPLSADDAFLRAVNDEIKRQVLALRSGSTVVRPVSIPVPNKLTMFPSRQAQRLYDVEVKPSFTDESKMTGDVIDFGLVHPLTGVVFFGDDCSTVDFRRHDDPADFQAYWTTCDRSTTCTHKPYSRTDIFSAENRTLVALPLYAPYFIQVRVQISPDSQEQIPAVKALSAVFHYLQ